VDTLGGFDTAITLARARAGIAADQEVRYVVYPKVQRSFFNRVLNQVLNEPDVRGTALRLPGVEVLRSVVRLAGRPSLAWMPWEIEIR
jgi:ClpP class serine protease